MKKKNLNDSGCPQTSLPVYGEDSEGNRRRGFDFVRINGNYFIQSVNSDGRKITIPIVTAKNAFMKLKEKSTC